LLFILFFIFLIDFLFNFIPNHLVLFDFHIKFSSHAFIIYKSFHQLICFSNFISHHLILISFSSWILPLFFYCCLFCFGSFFILFFQISSLDILTLVFFSFFLIQFHLSIFDFYEIGIYAFFFILLFVGLSKSYSHGHMIDNLTQINFFN